MDHLLLEDHMTIFLAALEIFLLRICDVSIGTIRVIYTVRGRRLISFVLGLVESAVFITAISHVFKDLNSPWKMVGYALGFATGTALGITLEQWIGSGWVLARIITRQALGLAERLRSEGFGVTVVHAEGKDGEVIVLFVVMGRRRSKVALQIIDDFDPDAFVTLEPVTHARGGYVAHTTPPASGLK